MSLSKIIDTPHIAFSYLTKVLSTLAQNSAQKKYNLLFHTCIQIAIQCLQLASNMAKYGIKLSTFVRSMLLNSSILLNILLISLNAFTVYYLS